MSGHRDRHIARSGVVPQAPPPPVLRGPGRSGRRSRSRSRSPRRSRHSLPAHHHEPLSRQKSEGRGRGNRRSRSPFPSGSNPHVNMDPFNRLNHHPALAALPSSVPVILPQSISLITTEGGIIRRILNADEVKIPRRLGEGARPIFERDELKEALSRRYPTDEDGLNAGGASLPVPQPTTQRVIAIIREPGPGEMIVGPYRNNHDNPSSFRERDGGARGDSRRQQRPNSPHLRASNHLSSSKRSLSPPTRERDARDSKTGRSRQMPLERNHDVEVRGRERSPFERIHIADKHRSKERPDRSKTRPIDRSPVRILRDRPERHSRSRSHTPPPMPPEIRRQMIERARDLRNKLSRPAKILNKFDSAHDFRGEGSSSSTFRGGRGGFRGRGGGSFRSREENSSSRGNWEHDKFLENAKNDMYEWEKSDGDKN